MAIETIEQFYDVLIDRTITIMKEMGLLKIDYEDISKYKYLLKQTYSVMIPEFAGVTTPEKYTLKKVQLMPDGIFQAKKGYAWDGPSGPTIDTDTFIRASLIHDGLYQLIREGVIPKSTRKKADKVLYRLCREDGMSWFRAKYVYRGVRWFGGLHV